MLVQAERSPLGLPRGFFRLVFIVGFVGLIVPHVARLVGGPNHTRLIPLAMLGGATFLVLADLLARIVAPPTEIPLGIVTAFVGGPLFLYLLRKSRREYRV